MLWRYLRPAILPLLIVAAAYVAWPALDAYRLNRAIHTADLAEIRGRVDWTDVRQSLQRSVLARMAEQVRERPAKPGLIKRVAYKIADAMTPRMLEQRLIQDVSPQGFARHAVEPETGAAAPSRLGMAPAEPAVGRSILQRIRSARFLGLTRVEVVLEDKRDAGRVYRAELRLSDDFIWKLASVEVLSLGTGF